jgi:hypothetical protein
MDEKFMENNVALKIGKGQRREQLMMVPFAS